MSDIETKRSVTVAEVLKVIKSLRDAPRPTVAEILDALRATALQQLRTTEAGRSIMVKATQAETDELIESIVRNQTSIVDMWIDVAINGE